MINIKSIMFYNSLVQKDINLKTFRKIDVIVILNFYEEPLRAVFLFKDGVLSRDTSLDKSIFKGNRNGMGIISQF